MSCILQVIFGLSDHAAMLRRHVVDIYVNDVEIAAAVAFARCFDASDATSAVGVGNLPRVSSLRARVGRRRRHLRKGGQRAGPAWKSPPVPSRVGTYES